MIFLLAGIAVALTYCMFATKNLMLGFPCGIFWAVLAGHSYGLSTATWDTEYFVFFAAIGMAVFSIYAAFALKPKDIELSKEDSEDSEKYIDESPESTKAEGEAIENVPTSNRVSKLRQRAEQRRKVNRILRSNGQ